ncbi:hypothetical protein PLIIFM63780_006610 [Purpureocillium lilacinum]|nr:hypothetical protein PLIIFM63780_006610 [Purpureocillium lilacinum]
MLNVVDYHETKRWIGDLGKIAERHDGNRAFGTPGSEASMDLILGQLQPYKSVLDMSIRKFSHPFEWTNEISLSTVTAQYDEVESLRFNSATPPDGVFGRLIDPLQKHVGGSLCTPDQWEAANVNATGNILLMDRGGCAMAKKLELATKHGARAVIFYQDTSEGISTGDAVNSAQDIGKVVPAGITTRENGLKWIESLKTGQAMTATLAVNTTVQDRTVLNIIAETKQGDPNKVIMLGAHLDSFPGGPGLDDNASGAAAVLQILHCFAQHQNITNKVRFAWWGAGKAGQAGSRHYVSQLSDEEARKIAFYFNFDQMATPHPNYTVHANNDADLYGATVLFEQLQEQGVVPQVSNFTTVSDHIGFVERGIPTCGISTGNTAGRDDLPLHVSDNWGNVERGTLKRSIRAAAVAVAQLVLSKGPIPRPDAFHFNTTRMSNYM